MEKLQLNDPALVFEPESSAALGFGFRCGFLGLLHMDVIQERLEREYGQTLIATAPSVNYQVTMTDHAELEVDNPSRMPPAQNISDVQEPWVEISIIAPARYIGPIMELVTGRRGEFQNMEYLQASYVCHRIRRSIRSACPGRKGPILSTRRRFRRFWSTFTIS